MVASLAKPQVTVIKLTVLSHHGTTPPSISDDSRLPAPGSSVPFEPKIRDQSWAPHRRHNMTDPGLYDHRLRDVRASTWTSVVVEDRVFASIISSYLTWDHPPWRLFDEDMFINDLVAGRATHCSRLLVNAILAYGCVSRMPRRCSRQALPDTHHSIIMPLSSRPQKLSGPFSSSKRSSYGISKRAQSR